MLGCWTGRSPRFASPSEYGRSFGPATLLEKTAQQGRSHFYVEVYSGGSVRSYAQDWLVVVAS
jgi:hypothetical protein